MRVFCLRMRALPRVPSHNICVPHILSLSACFPYVYFSRHFKRCAKVRHFTKRVLSIQKCLVYCMHTRLMDRLMKVTQSIEMLPHKKPTLYSPNLCAYCAIFFTQSQYTRILYCAICISENGQICKCLHELCHDTHLNESCQVWISHIIYLR